MTRATCLSVTSDDPHRHKKLLATAESSDGGTPYAYRKGRIVNINTITIAARKDLHHQSMSLRDGTTSMGHLGAQSSRVKRKRKHSAKITFHVRPYMTFRQVSKEKAEGTIARPLTFYKHREKKQHRMTCHPGPKHVRFTEQRTTLKSSSPGRTIPSFPTSSWPPAPCFLMR